MQITIIKTEKSIKIQNISFKNIKEMSKLHT